MTRVIYVEEGGEQHTIDLTPGTSVMQGAVDNMLPSIVGECGGIMTCCTCHCYIETEWRQKIPGPCQMESELLQYVDDTNENSRLGCQIKVDDSLDGLLVRLPQEV